jgi:hypothetical protein
VIKNTDTVRIECYCGVTEHLASEFMRHIPGSPGKVARKMFIMPDGICPKCLCQLMAYVQPSESDWPTLLRGL